MSSANLVALASTSAFVSSLFPFTRAFSFNIDNSPTQCGDLQISITGSDGTPPYRALILPFGGSPLKNAVEVRTIIDHEFDDGATSTSFQLNYPALSQFVVVVSDSKEFGSGGTSAAATVVDSDDSSCYNSSATTSVTPNFYYFLDPDNQFVQCTTSRIWWDPSSVKGTPTFYGVIPGGDSFNISFTSTTQKANEGTGFDWVPAIRGGTTLMVGAGDDRGLGSGGSVTYIVSSGNGNTTCLNSDSPSSTAGSPAGGSYPTSTSEAEAKHSSSNAGPIAGGVVAALVVICAFILVLIFLRRRKKQAAQNKEKPDLFMDNERPTSAQEGEIARLAPPEPYIVPSEPARSEWGAESSTGAPTSSYGYGIGTGAAAAAATASSSNAFDRRYSVFSESIEQDHLRPGTPQTTASSSMMGSGRKGAPPVLRPVNIIQHEDAGAPPPDGEGEPETIELPPAYTNIHQG